MALRPSGTRLCLPAVKAWHRVEPAMPEHYIEQELDRYFPLQDHVGRERPERRPAKLSTTVSFTGSPTTMRVRSHQPQHTPCSESSIFSTPHGTPSFHDPQHQAEQTPIASRFREELQHAHDGELWQSPSFASFAPNAPPTTSAAKLHVHQDLGSSFVSMSPAHAGSATSAHPPQPEHRKLGGSTRQRQPGAQEQQRAQQHAESSRSSTLAKQQQHKQHLPDVLTSRVSVFDGASLGVQDHEHTLFLVIQPQSSGDEEQDGIVVELSVRMQDQSPNNSFALQAFQQCLASARVIYTHGGRRMAALLLQCCSSAIVGRGANESIAVRDTQVAAWLADPERAWDDMDDVFRLCQLRPVTRGAGDLGDSSASASSQWLHKLASRHAAAFDHLFARLRACDQAELYSRLEAPAIWLLAEMQVHGIHIDTETLKQQRVQIQQCLAELEARAEALVGFKLLLTSPLQLREYLYDQLQLHVGIPNFPRTPKGKLSTGEDALTLIKDRHELPNLLLLHRRAARLLCTYIDGVLPHVTHGMLHPEWLQTSAASGRVSCQQPNIQSVPLRETALRLDLLVVSPRAAYVAPGGCVYVSLDWRQMELRLLAHFSEDEGLIALFQNQEAKAKANTPPSTANATSREEGGTSDPFKALASKWFCVPVEQVTGRQRDQVKRCLYAFIYGSGALHLSKVLEVSVHEAKKLLQAFRRRHPRIQHLRDQVLIRLKETGFVSCLSRRRRYFKDSANDHSQRAAFNFLLQGSAADICKAAMINLREFLRAKQMRSFMVAQLHDEIILECPEKEAKEVLAFTRGPAFCEPFGRMRVPFPVRQRIGRTWADMS
ncbi:hypothetical protein PTSG_00018 [Salpingoeca rosetta]|uniref:DNA-directed DNA polymerase n=1 Tax=Salpingoeca rosetta (strain ATCC 50818 / BSB-021) TaxID=946362 RepID=F2TVA6_SALR5|nr:uncharacterized protein PTSG_00018 [Salpingoeca rosetta]EGD72002.1 hypothetical protein PTSG_00018 [Salpingoeca rosetta]|eukprot:XP_004998574.1 hypothetical protein PTSG_00018 [Salpingoeca rosetta]